MFQARKRSKINHQSGSRESVSSTGNPSTSSTENLSSVKEGQDVIDMRVLYQKVTFEVYFIGMVPNINMGNSQQRDTEAQLIDHIEEAQIDGKLPNSVQEDSKVKLSVSQYGLQVLDIKGKEYLQRHPLHTVAQVVQYDDAMGKHNIAVKIGQVTKTVFQCYVFQCLSEQPCLHAFATGVVSILQNTARMEQAQTICHSIRRIFDAITMKTG